MSDGASGSECSSSSRETEVSFSVRQVGARGVRRGELRVGRAGACVATPAFVTPTVKGYVPHTTPQLLAETAMPRVLGVALPDLVDDAALVDATTAASAGAGAGKRGTLWGAGAAAAHADALLYAFMGDVAPLRPPTINARHLVCVASKRGNELVAPARLVALARAPCVAAHVLEAPALECAHDESASRHGKCEAATVAILDQCLAAAAAADRAEAPPLAVVACVLGGVSEKQRRAAAEHVAKRDGVFGYCFGELGLGESQAERAAALQAALPCLDAARLRVVKRVAAPADVLRLVADGAAGVDLFVTDWPDRLARAGYALCFPLPPDASAGTAAAAEEGKGKEDGKEEEDFPGSDGTKFSMDSTALVDDHRVLVRGCACHACRNGYTRAYLHHLRNTHEMLADILLTQHNQHRYAAFFAALRAAADADTLDSFAALYTY